MILEDLDALAGNFALNHVQGNVMIITTGVDHIRIRERPAIGVDQYLLGKVTWVRVTLQLANCATSGEITFCFLWLRFTSPGGIILNRSNISRGINRLKELNFLSHEELHGVDYLSGKDAMFRSSQECRAN
jgi:hypothetical protein